MPVSQQNTLADSDLGVSVADSHATYFPSLTRVMDAGESIHLQGEIKLYDYSYSLSGILASDDDMASNDSNLIKDTEIRISMQTQGSFDEADDTFDFSDLTDSPATDHKDDGTLNALELRVSKDDAASSADEPGLPGVTVYLDANHNDPLGATPSFADGFVF